jgi:hypothetical protein
MKRFVSGRAALGILALGGLLAGATRVALAGKEVFRSERRVARGKDLVSSGRSGWDVTWGRRGRSCLRCGGRSAAGSPTRT